MPTYLFIYHNLDWFTPNDDPCYLGPALLDGALYQHGTQPLVVKHASHTVVGALYVVGLQTLSAVDIAMRQTLRPILSHPYLRRTAFIRRLGDGKMVTAWVYGYHHPPELSLPIEPIPHGDYRRYQLEQQSHAKWVVAYGSNLSVERLQARVGPPLAYRRGYLPGFRLVFNKKARHGDTVYANLRYMGDEPGCPAVAYLLSMEQVAQLDKFEGTPAHYLRITLPFHTDDGSLTAYCYVAHPQVIVPAKEPSSEYMAHIQQGYQEHGFVWGA